MNICLIERREFVSIPKLTDNDFINHFNLIGYKKISVQLNHLSKLRTFMTIKER